MPILEVFGSLTLSEALLKVKSAGMVILGKELNIDVSSESCFMGTEEGTRKIGLSFAAVFAASANLKSGSVLAAGPESNKDNRIGVLFVLVLEDMPKIDLDSLACLTANRGFFSGDDRVLSFRVASLDTVDIGLSVLSGAPADVLDGKEESKPLSSGRGDAGAVSRPGSACDLLVVFSSFL